MSIHAPLPDFREFRFPSRATYLLDALGGVCPNPLDPGNPLVECLLTPLIPRGLEPESSRLDASGSQLSYSRKISEQVRVGVGVGNLSNLFMGRFVKDGQFLEDSPAEARIPERITYEIDTADPGACQDEFLDAIEFDAAHALISTRQRSLGVKSPIKRLRGYLRSTSNKRAPQTGAALNYGALEVLIHELELVRFYYTNSSYLTRSVFGGLFAKEYMYKAIFSDESDANRYDASTDTHRFVHRYGLEDNDMPILGRILFEPDDRALRGVRRIHTSLRVSNIASQERSTGRYPRTSFPFSQATELTLVGHRAKCQDGGYVFIAHRIERCTADFPFRNLAYASIRIEATGPRPAQSDDIHKPGSVRTHGPVNSLHGQEDAQNRSDIPPNADSITVAREAGTRIFAGLKKVRVSRTIRQSDQPKRQARRGRFNPGLTDLSTGRRSGGWSSAAQLSIHERVESGALTANLDAFIQSIQALQALQPDWTIRFIPVGVSPWRDEDSEIYRGYFPETRCLIRQSMLTRFAYLDYGSKVRRQVIGVEIEAQSKFAYLFEAQRRVRAVVTETGGEGIRYLDTLPILILSSKDFAYVEPNDFASMLWMTVLNPSRTWPSDIGDFHRSTVAHGRGADTPVAMANRIAGAVITAMKLQVRPIGR